MGVEVPRRTQLRHWIISVRGQTLCCRILAWTRLPLQLCLYVPIVLSRSSFLRPSEWIRYAEYWLARSSYPSLRTTGNRKHFSTRKEYVLALISGSATPRRGSESWKAEQTDPRVGNWSVNCQRRHTCTLRRSAERCAIGGWHGHKLVCTRIQRIAQPVVKALLVREMIGQNCTQVRRDGFMRALD